MVFAERMPMFLRYLSEFDYEPCYWSFVLRMETVIDGFVKEAARHIDNLSQEQARNYFENCFAVCFRTDPHLLAENWWGDKIPPIDWFWDFFDREFPFMLQEARQRANRTLDSQSRENQETDSSTTCSCGHHHDNNQESCHHNQESLETEPLNRAKVRQYAHEYEPFRLFLQDAGMIIPEELK